MENFKFSETRDWNTYFQTFFVIFIFFSNRLKMVIPDSQQSHLLYLHDVRYPPGKCIDISPCCKIPPW